MRDLATTSSAAGDDGASPLRGGRGFTLIELLAVMAIMILLATIGISSYFSMTRGAGMRSALYNLKGSLQLARQTALSKGRKTCVIFYPDGYVSCQKAGVGEYSGNTRRLVARYVAPSDFVVSNTVVYNLGTGAGSLVSAVSASNAVVMITTSSNIWSAAGGDTFGFEINPKIYLPRGFLFDPGTPETVYFNGDGTTRPSSYVIAVYEEINAEHKPAIVVEALTGFIRQ